MLGHVVLMTVAWFFVLPIGKHISKRQLPYFLLIVSF